jgi:DNA-binding NarL/FixJ family response regulator
MTYRVLVVDDYEPWRRHVATTLANSSRWRIVAEAADGLEAVEKAADLRPDLILLDVGLPTLNGIEAARRMLARDPNLRILFVSEHQSWEVAEAALSTGAQGYICKSDSGRELSPAMDAIVDGRRFVAARFGGRVVESTSRQSSPNGRRHEALYYSDDASLLEQWASIGEAALSGDATFFVVATDSHRDRLQAMLQARGVNVAHAIRAGRYVSVSPDKALSKFMVGDRLDETRFWDTLAPLMLGLAKASTAEHPHVVACGECAPTLCERGNAEAAVRLEQLWDEVTKTYQLDTFCGYSSDGCRCEDPSTVHEKIRAVHTGTYEN